MTREEVMLGLEALGKERIKKLYMGRGAREPLFGVATGEMKPLFRQIKKDQALAEELYATGNYDAMYFAGMIADPKAMTEADFDRWMESAYFPMLSDFVVSVTLSEARCAQSVATAGSTAARNCICPRGGHAMNGLSAGVRTRNLTGKSSSPCWNGLLIRFTISRTPRAVR